MHDYQIFKWYILCYKKLKIYCSIWFQKDTILGQWLERTKLSLVIMHVPNLWFFLKIETSVKEHLGKDVNIIFIDFNNNKSMNLSCVQFSHSVMSDSLWPHKSQHARPPCPSPTPGVHSNSCPSSRWYHTAISSSVVPFSSCLLKRGKWLGHNYDILNKESVSFSVI